MGLSRSVGACDKGGDGGPMCFVFSSEYDCSSRTLETIVRLVLSLTVSLCRKA
jgi:hypothetical protein